MNDEPIFLDELDDDGQPDIVEWYETRPVSAATATAVALGAFALGALTAVGALVLFRYFED